MQALLLAAVLASTAPLADAALRARFEQYVGPAIADAAGCYAGDDRYVACVQSASSGEVWSIVVVPRAWRTGGDFDREQALTPSEYLGLLSRIDCAVPIGPYRPGSEPLVNAVTNLRFITWESWGAAAIEKNVNLGDDAVISFRVIFYRPVRGVVFHHDPRCDWKPVTEMDRLLFFCDEHVDTGPRYLSIDNARFLLAPSEWRDYCPGQEVEVLAADLDDPYPE
jgi:hypothetical protein